MTVTPITREIAAKVLAVVDAGLSNGVGNPIPGFMCVEAAVCYALDLPHGDKPTCVSPALRNLKIALNDKNWSSKAARAAGLRRLAIVQLGSAGVLDDREFLCRVADMAIRKTAAGALRIAASVQKNVEQRQKLIDAAHECEVKGTRAAALNGNRAAANAYDAAANANANAANAAANAADAAGAAADAAYAYDAANAADAAANAADAAANAADAAANAARNKQLAAFAEDVVQILIAMNAPGCQWLDLAPVAA